MSADTSKKSHPIAWIFTVVFIILLAVAGGEYQRASALQPYLQPQSGVVTQLHEKVEHERNGWKDAVQGKFMLAGRGYGFYSLRKHDSVHIGDTVAVVYDSRDPANSGHMGYPRDIWTDVVIQFIFAGVVGFGVLLVWVNIISGGRPKNGPA